MRIIRVLMLAVLSVLLAAPGASSASPIGPTITHSVMVGDVRSDSATLWARGSDPGVLHVRLAGGAHRPVDPILLTGDHDFTGRVRTSRQRNPQRGQSAQTMT